MARVISRTILSTMVAAANSSFSELNSPVRPANFGDARALTRLINAAFVAESVAFDGDRVDEQGVRGYMNTGTFLVVEGVARLSGCVYVECDKERSYLGLLSVDPPRQGLGLGRRLVAEAEKFALGTGCVVMDLRVISPRAKQLLPFYLKLGYHEAGAQPFPHNLSSKVPAHYVLMSKRLT
jgi:GNAT superfamily N-acetyltransferase